MILVVGASGLLGGAITRQVLAQGKSVRILTRENPAYQPLIDAGAQPVAGDLKDRASLDAACQGVTTVITTANAAGRGSSDTFESVDWQGTKNLIDAAKAAGVEHFIYTSAYGSDINSQVPLVRIKAQCEQYLKESGVPYTILAPHIFIEVWVGMMIGTAMQSQQPVTLVGKGDHAHAFISIADIAAIAAACVDNPAAKNQYIAIGGPSMTWTEIVQRTGKALGRDLPIQYVPMGSPLPIPPMIWDLMYSTEAYETRIDMTAVNAAYGVTQTPFEMVVGRMFAPPAH